MDACTGNGFPGPRNVLFAECERTDGARSPSRFSFTISDLNWRRLTPKWTVGGLLVI